MGPILADRLSTLAAGGAGFLRRELVRPAFGMSGLAPLTGDLLAPFLIVHGGKATSALGLHRRRVDFTPYPWQQSRDEPISWGANRTQVVHGKALLLEPL
jgi:hypothetical protein